MNFTLPLPLPRPLPPAPLPFPPSLFSGISNQYPPLPPPPPPPPIAASLSATFLCASASPRPPSAIYFLLPLPSPHPIIKFPPRHLFNPPFPCRLCGRSFPSHQTLTHHFTSVYSPEYERRLQRLGSATGRRLCILSGQLSLNISRYEKAHRELFGRCENGIDEVKRAGFRVLVGEDKTVHVYRELENQQRVNLAVIVSDDLEFVRVLGQIRRKGVKSVVIGELKGDNGIKKHGDAGFCWREVLTGKVKAEGPKVVIRWREKDLLERLEWRYDPRRDDKEELLSTGNTGEEKAKAKPWWKLDNAYEVF